jgi:hypothetical protein
LTGYGPIDIKATDYVVIKPYNRRINAEYLELEAGRTDTKSVARKAKKPKSDGSSKVVRPSKKLGGASDKKRSKPVSEGTRKGKDWGLRGE